MRDTIDASQIIWHIDLRCMYLWACITHYDYIGVMNFLLPPPLISPPLSLSFLVLCSYPLALPLGVPPLLPPLPPSLSVPHGLAPCWSRRVWVVASLWQPSARDGPWSIKTSRSTLCSSRLTIGTTLGTCQGLRFDHCLQSLTWTRLYSPRFGKFA